MQKLFRKFNENLLDENKFDLPKNINKNNLVFLVGRRTFLYSSDKEVNYLQDKLRIESELYSDILQEDFIDSYHNLTLKSIMLLKWVANRCKEKVSYILKVDDDTFVNIPNLLHVLTGQMLPLYNATLHFYDYLRLDENQNVEKYRSTTNLLLGHRFCGVKPVSDLSSKWYAPYYLYKSDVYPPYLSGTAYVMSVDVALRLYNETLVTPYFHLEDVFITGICAAKQKIRRRHNPLFHYSFTKDNQKSLMFCAMKGLITQHNLTPAEMLIAFEALLNNYIACESPQYSLVYSQAKIALKRNQKGRC